MNTPESFPVASTAATMRAVAHTRFGPPSEALEITEVSTPTVGDDEVLVRVAAAGVAIGDWFTTTGVPYVARPMFGIRSPKQPIAGLELAGTVVAVGRDVARFSVGDEVFGWGKGTLAEYAAVAQDSIAIAPTTATPIEAAALPISAVTALQAVRDHGKVTSGQAVLIIGASGAVGSFAVQIAKAFGAEVTGVASTRNLELLGSIGADHVVDYRTTAVADAGRRYDVIFDLGGNTPLKDLRNILAPEGTLVIIGGSGGRFMMGFGRTLRAVGLNSFVGQTLMTFIAKNTSDDLVALAEMIDTGDVTPVIDRTYPLDEAAAAIEHVGSGQTSGKTVITV